MSKIRIKNFGPIRSGFQENDGWMDIKKVTVFIGNQGSGKSTVAKLISTFSWIEKALTRGDYDIKWFTSKKFKNTYCSYHRLENYFIDQHGNDLAELEYQGQSYSMSYKRGNLTIEEIRNTAYHLPQIMYVPSERNFISTVKKPSVLKFSSAPLVEFVTEFDNAKNSMKESLALPVNGTEIEYDKLNDIVNIRGEDYKVRLTEASSGFQSVVPLFLVTWFLAHSVKAREGSSNQIMSSDELERFRKGVADIWSNDSLTDQQKRTALSVLSSRFNKTAFINIVEEPEQNLFPDSQRLLLNDLLLYNNLSDGNKLIMTTHSPYIINFLSIAIQANYLYNKIFLADKEPDLAQKVYSIISFPSSISSHEVAIYQLNESTGIINELPKMEGIPSDGNYLNQSLAEGNRLFDSLLEIEEQI